MDFQKIKKNIYNISVIFIICLFFTLFFFENSKLESNLSKEEKGILSLSFDDGYISHYNLAYPLMEKYEFKGTEYLVANWSKKFEDKELMTFEQAKEMQFNEWEIGSHGLNHANLAFLSKEDLEKNLNLSREILIKEGFNISSIAFPYGSYNKNISNSVKNYYFSARPLINDYNLRNSENLYELKSKWIDKNSEVIEVCSWIKYAKLNNLWLILVFHNIKDSPTEYWDESTKDFQEILKCINESNIEVKTISGVINEKRD